MRAPDSWSPINADGGIRWSWHVIARYLQCPRLFELEVVKNLAPIRYNNNLAIGTAVHYALAHVFLELQQLQQRHGGPFAVNEEWCSYFAGKAESILQSYTGDLAEADRWTAIRVAKLYCNGNGDPAQGGPCDFQQLEILQVEETLRVDLATLLPVEEQQRLGHLWWSQTPDLVVRALPGYPHVLPGVWTYDHKTMSRKSRSLRDQYRRDGQAILATATARALSADVTGFVINAISKATNSADLAKGVVEFDLPFLQRAVRIIARWQRQIEVLLQVGVTDWPEAWTSCLGKYGYCDFWDYCHDGYTDGYCRRDQLRPGDALAQLNQGYEIAGLD